MAKSKASGNHRPGGGIASRQHVETGYRTGKSKERIRHAGVAQIGQRQGNHVTEQGATSYGGINPFTGAKGFPSELGNILAPATKCGPGSSRTVYKSGFQDQHGAPDKGDPMPRGKELWPG
jgi:hypothetical protein